DEFLSIKVNAAADGTFELAGLTPGDYRVQATLDDIWLSASIPLVVTEKGMKKQPIRLNMAAPGGPSVVELIDAKGRPAAERRLRLVRPSGPLTDELWPMELSSDGAGIVQIPPLETGKHEITIPGTDIKAKLIVPSLAESSGKSGVLRIVVD